MAILILFNDYNFVDPQLYETVKDAKSLDVLNVASQIGRFDLISMFLGIVAVFIGIVAVLGFWTIRGAALKSASDAAREEMKATGEKHVKEWIEKHGRTFFEAAGSVQEGSAVPSIGIGDEKAAQITKNADEIKED
ncbi:hypothetical protein D3C87_1700800 [compost metagenome]